MFSYDTDSGLIRMYGDIGPYVDAISEVEFMEALDDMGGRDIELHLSSDGGDVGSGVSIYNQIANYSGKVTVVIDAMAASIASYFPMAAAEVVAHENSTVMIHNPWTVALGDAGELRRVADVLEQFGLDIAEGYAAKAGGTPEDWLDVMNQERYYRASDALAAGLVDRIRGKGKVAAKGDKPKASVAPAFAKMHCLLKSQRLRMKF